MKTVTTVVASPIVGGLRQMSRIFRSPKQLDDGAPGRISPIADSSDTPSPSADSPAESAMPSASASASPFLSASVDGVPFTFDRIRVTVARATVVRAFEHSIAAPAQLEREVSVSAGFAFELVIAVDSIEGPGAMWTVTRRVRDFRWLTRRLRFGHASHRMHCVEHIHLIKPSIASHASHTAYIAYIVHHTHCTLRVIVHRLHCV